MKTNPIPFRHLQQSLGVVCKSARQENEWSIRDAERATGLPRSALSKIENGTANPCLRTLEKLIAVYGIELIQTVEWLAKQRSEQRRLVRIAS